MDWRISIQSDFHQEQSLRDGALTDARLKDPVGFSWLQHGHDHENQTTRAETPHSVWVSSKINLLINKKFRKKFVKWVNLITPIRCF